MLQKEIFWRQRSKQLWLQAGNTNSKFFHASASARRRQNTVCQLKNSQGDWVNWNTGLDRLNIDYFSDVCQASHVDCLPVSSLIQSQVSVSQNADLLQPISEEEVRCAVFQMHPDKSPGPDGMTPGFFQKSWSTIQRDVCHMVQHFFSTGTLPKDINHTP